MFPLKNKTQKRKECPIMTDKYIYKATNLIAEEFDRIGIKYNVKKQPFGVEELKADYGIDCGPDITVSFITTDDDNDVAVRVFGIVKNIPKSKRHRAEEVCSTLSDKVRLFKFVPDCIGNINAEYDFPEKISDDCVGEVAIEMFVKIINILDTEYPFFIKAFYTDEDLSENAYFTKLKATAEHIIKRREKGLPLGFEEGDSDLDFDDFDFDECNCDSDNSDLC